MNSFSRVGCGGSAGYLKVWQLVTGRLDSTELRSLGVTSSFFHTVVEMQEWERCCEYDQRTRRLSCANVHSINGIGPFIERVSQGLPGRIRKSFLHQVKGKSISGKLLDLMKIVDEFSTLVIRDMYSYWDLSESFFLGIRSLWNKAVVLESLEKRAESARNKRVGVIASIFQKGGVLALDGELGNLCERLRVLSLEEVSFFMPPPERAVRSVERCSLESMGLSRLPFYVEAMEGLLSLSLWGNRVDLSYCPVLEHLELLDLSRNGLKEIPEVVLRLENLRALYLVGNEIDRLPDIPGILPSLSLIDLTSNRIQDVPDGFWPRRLLMVNLSQNELKAIPSALFSMIELFSLVIEDNQICEVPKQIMRLKDLRVLSLSGNPLNSFPADVVFLNSLRVLGLASIGMKEIPKSIVFLEQLQFLSIQNNRLKVFNKVHHFKELRALQASGNRMRFSVDDRHLGHKGEALNFCDVLAIEKSRGTQEGRDIVAWGRYGGRLYFPEEIRFPRNSLKSVPYFPSVSFIMQAALFVLE